MTQEGTPSRAIAADLRTAIASGDLAPEAKLPSERALAVRYKTARNTARAAVRLLTEEGLVVAHHGRGVFVRPDEPLIRLGSDRYSHKYRETGLSPFLLECAKVGKTGRFSVLAIDVINAAPIVAEMLDVTEGSAVLRRENVFYADEDPVYRVTTYIPNTIASGTGLEQPEVPHQYGIHGVLEDLGYTMARLREDVNARMPTRDEARHLQLAGGVPVLDVWHISVTDQVEAYELTRFVMRADMSTLRYDTPVE